MTTIIPTRLRMPLLTAVFGLAFSAAWLARGGKLSWIAIPAAAATVIRVIAVWREGRGDSDLGALAGSRADERQQQVSLASRALGWNLTMLASMTGLIAGIAVRGSWWWPFALILAVGAYGYLLGLSNNLTGDSPEGHDSQRPHAGMRGR
jgi:hypothetical protein